MRLTTKGRFAVTAMIVLVLLSGVMREWILGPGVFWSEGLYTWCILAALYAATRSAAARSATTQYGWAAAVGALLGLSAYVRSISDILGWLMVVVLLGWAALTGVRVAIRRWQRKRASPT